MTQYNNHYKNKTGSVSLCCKAITLKQQKKFNFIHKFETKESYPISATHQLVINVKTSICAKNLKIKF